MNIMKLTAAQISFFTVCASFCFPMVHAEDLDTLSKISSEVTEAYAKADSAKEVFLCVRYDKEQYEKYQNKSDLSVSSCGNGMLQDWFSEWAENAFPSSRWDFAAYSVNEEYLLISLEYQSQLAIIEEAPYVSEITLYNDSIPDESSEDYCILEGLEMGQIWVRGNVDSYFTNTVDANDAACILIASARIGAGKDSGFTRAQMNLADVNGDGTVDASDASIILQYSAACGVNPDTRIEDYFCEPVIIYA